MIKWKCISENNDNGNAVATVVTMTAWITDDNDNVVEVVTAVAMMTTVMMTKMIRIMQRWW